MARNDLQLDSHVSLFLDRELRAVLERAAMESDRSLSAEVRVRLRASTFEHPAPQSVPVTGDPPSERKRSRPS